MPAASPAPCGAAWAWPPGPRECCGAWVGAQGSSLRTPDSSLPTQAGAGPEEGGPVLPFSCVACSSGSLGTRSSTGGGAETAGPGSCLWGDSAGLRALLCFPGDWGAELALSRRGGRDTTVVLYFESGLY